MILLIDNYDSFVYNLARYVSELGYDYVVKRNDKVSLAEIETLSPSHIILSPGPGTPLQAGKCMAIVKRFAATTPILGVCLGHQAIAAAFGANITRALKPMHGKATSVEHDGLGIFSELPSPLTVARYHSLIVGQVGLPVVLQVTATSAEHEIMGLRHQSYPCVGVQFHPESILTELGHKLLAGFLRLSEKDER